MSSTNDDNHTMSKDDNEISWEAELADLLEQLSAAQAELLALLQTKGEFIRQQDHQGLAELAPQEEAVAQRLMACQQRREDMLAAAGEQGLPSQSLLELGAAIPVNEGSTLGEDLLAARDRAKLVRHECLAQWVVVQRTVLHLSQLLEIIATGGRSQPTYGNGQPPRASGSLMDQAV